MTQEEGNLEAKAMELIKWAESIAGVYATGILVEVFTKVQTGLTVEQAKKEIEKKYCR